MKEMIKFHDLSAGLKAFVIAGWIFIVLFIISLLAGLVIFIIAIAGFGYLAGTNLEVYSYSEVGEPVLLTEKLNYNGTCTKNSECGVPGEYLVRSSCPFSAYCVEGQCKTGCSMFFHSSNPDNFCKADAECNCSSYSPADLKECKCLNGECVALVK